MQTKHDSQTPGGNRFAIPQTLRRYESNDRSVIDTIVAAFTDTVGVGIVYHGDPAEHGGNHVVVIGCPRSIPTSTVTVGGHAVKIGGGRERERSTKITVGTSVTVKEGRVGRV